MIENLVPAPGAGPDDGGVDLRQAAVWPGIWALLADDRIPGRERPGPEIGVRAGDGAGGRVGSSTPLVVDAGGGSGGFAVPIAAAGYPVIVVDPSPDALAALRRRATERGLGDRITAVQGDLGDLGALVGNGRADLLLCHSVLDVVDDPAAALTQALRVLRPGGGLSLLVAGQAAAVLHRVLAGRLDEALAAFAGEAGRVPRPARRFCVAEAVALVRAAGGEVLDVHGARIFADLVPGERLADPRVLESLRRLELAAARHESYRDLAAHLHVLARRPGPTPAQG
ncbi:methyltransferase domain-containing protein [Frankia sp. R82]|uniref:methyltransferase domain-containing protein n=1 Tax=Frankia sp. R82 TaxID=2950553 RepID=UPI0020437B65|nr:methyltransferase domain-containing protein [Frankia sp. R82]MCM3886434.1 methyltransferase domain-containing protein [Frankia sp. R82]